MALDKTVSYSGQNQVDTLTSRVRLEEGKGRLVIFDGSNNLGVFGFDSQGQVAVKIAKPGFDADTATDEQLIFNSSQNVFKIVKSGTATIPAISLTTPANQYNGTQQSATVAHGLGYAPLVTAYYAISGGYAPFPDNQYSGYASNAFTLRGFTYYVDSTNLYLYENLFAYNQSSSFPSVSVKYYLLQETAS